jgi:hypothetical protein
MFVWRRQLFICVKELSAQFATELDGITLRDGEVDRLLWKLKSSGKFSHLACDQSFEGSFARLENDTKSVTNERQPC